jgi:hypothetical protein
MEPKKDAITATIGVFSGRPNPELLLTGALAEEFAGLVNATIGKEPIHPPPAPRLGFYYGFVVQISGELARRLGLAELLNVYHGVVTEGKGREQRHWRDVANVERFLIEESYRQGRGELLQRVGIERPK